MTLSHFIDNADSFAALTRSLTGASELALDTEFMRESTYHPQLCLVQLATAEQTYCIDPLALKDLGGLGELLADATICKVVHAARQDVEVLLTRCPQQPVNLFDTQVAAALLGMPPQVGYGELVHRLLDVKLDKAHTRTDWSRRPLSAEQLNYAADDVRHLLPLRERLQQELEQRGRWSWFTAEMQKLADPALYRTEPEQAWRRLKGLDALDERRAATAKALAGWREARAMHKDRPRGWILADDALRAIVDALPEDLQALAKVPLVPRGVIDKCGAEIMAQVAATNHLPSDDNPSRRYVRPDPEQQARLKALSAVVKEIAAGLDVSPEILATRRDLQQLVNGQTDIEPLRGWRRELLGEALLKHLPAS